VSTPTTPDFDPDAPSEADVVARAAEFSQLAPADAGEAGPTLAFLQDVPVTITARLGQVTLPIGEVLTLGPGAVLELDRDVTQPVELTVRGMIFARGEVVVVDDHFAIRIKELVTPRGKGSK
jgi:flagellar motor switch protein FliN